MRLTDPAALFAPLGAYKKWGLAVSGGPDSLALLLLAHAYAAGAANPPQLFVYSVDHGLRSEAAAEAEMVARVAQKLGLVARILRWTDPKPATGIQQAARAARYRLMGEAMREDGAEILLTAHHLNDQAETILMRMAHGSGLGGLRGMELMSAVEGVAVARPLLATDPEALAALVEAAGLIPTADPSNLDPGYERVRWRNALPLLASLGLDASRLSRFAERAGEADRALGLMTAQAFAEIVRQEGDLIVLPRARFAALPEAIAVRVLAQGLGQMGDWQKPHALAAVEALAHKLQHGVAAKAATLHGCLVRAGTKTIRIGRETGRSSVPKGAKHASEV